MATREVSDKILLAAVNVLCKSFGKGYHERGLADGKYAAVPTGHDDLDDVLTKDAKGIFLGGVVEICGPESSGKSSLAYRVCGNAQKMNMHCCWIDTEASFNSELAKINGCDPTKVVVPNLVDTKALRTEEDDNDDDNPNLSFFNVNEILEMVYKSICQNVYGIVVIDSVAGLISGSTLKEDADPNKAHVGEVPRAMSRFLPKIAQACAKTETTLILINQLRDKIGDYFADRFNTPGGKAVRFFSQQRLGIEKVMGEAGRVKDNGETIGHYGRVTIIKNKKAPPLQENVKIEIPIYYKPYFPDLAKRVYDLARRLKVITIRQGVLTYKSGNTKVFEITGESAVLEKIREDKMEARIAADLMVAEQSESNQKLNVPVKVPSAIAELAATYKADGAVAALLHDEEVKTKKKKANVPAL